MEAFRKLHRKRGPEKEVKKGGSRGVGAGGRVLDLETWRREGVGF